MTPHEDAPGPLEQAVAISFRVFSAAVLILAAVWLAGGIRRIPPDSRAVVMRLGRVARVSPPGLLLAWPRPVETVLLLPGPDRQLSRTVAALPRATGLDDVYTRTVGLPEQGAAGSYLTGDGGVVLLDATLLYRIADPAAYAIARSHVAPALDRLFRASAIAVAGRHGLDDFLVANPAGQPATRPGPASPYTPDAVRQAVRDELLDGVTARLRILEADGVGLGIAIDRLDLTAWLPPSAKLAFDAVLTATQVADQGIAAARTEAERVRQGATRERDRMLAAARATVAERISQAHTDVARVAALEAVTLPSDRKTLVHQLYLDTVSRLLEQVGAVTTVDARGGDARLILPGATRAPAQSSGLPAASAPRPLTPAYGPPNTGGAR